MIKKNFLLLCAAIVGNLLSAQSFEYFITASGNKLMEGKNEFRFMSYNIPNLNFVEDEMAFTTVCPFRYPTAYEIRDALLSIKQMGGRVARLYTIPVKRADQPDSYPSYVLGPGQFNEEAFKVNDLMLAIANEVGIRLVFPIVNNWQWMGGRPQYAAFRGKNQDDFWTDKQLIEDIKKTIEYTLNRTNTITGVKYKDDKAILCWETGNELGSPKEWTVTITRYIKQLDKNHLTMDGNADPLRAEMLDEPSIDIVNTHHYEINPSETIENIKKNLKTLQGKKPYIIGEFGFESHIALEKIMDCIIENKDIAGAMIWSLRSHREEGGFYWHSEPMGLGIYKAYHWPGFASGHSYDEESFVDAIRQKAFAIQAINPVPIDKPESPKLLEIKNVYNINWQGVTGASFYNIERAEKPEGPWLMIADHVNDADVQYTSLYHDKTAQIETSYYYRVIAGNKTGTSAPSNIVGPVKTEDQALIDDMSNFGIAYLCTKVSCVTGDDRKFKEDVYRIAGNTGSEIIYFVPGKLKALRVYSFENSADTVLALKTSANGKDFLEAKSKVSVYYDKNDYGSWYPVLYELPASADVKYVKLIFKNEAQISRVEIIYQ